MPKIDMVNVDIFKGYKQMKTNVNNARILTIIQNSVIQKNKVINQNIAKKRAIMEHFMALKEPPDLPSALSEEEVPQIPLTLQPVLSEEYPTTSIDTNSINNQVVDNSEPFSNNTNKSNKKIYTIIRKGNIINV